MYPNEVYIFDRNGNYISSFSQWKCSYGFKDLAWDGTHLYGSCSEVVFEFGTDGKIYGAFPGPLNPNRALAYNPATDHFWTANWASDIYEFDRTGTVIGNWPNSYHISGMAWDDASPDGPWLWVFAQDWAKICQYNPLNHEYTGLVFDVRHDGSYAGGMAFTREWDPSLGILVCLHQASPHDLVIGYQVVSLCHPIEPPQMRSQGYWRRQCKDDTHEDICAYVDSIHVLADLFESFDCDSICDLMRGSPSGYDMCMKARRQFMALLLNVASGKLAVCNCLEHEGKVGDVVADIDSLLSGSPDFAACEYAKTLADDINNGIGIVPCDTLWVQASPKTVRPPAISVAPNPFARSTVIEYELKNPGPIRLEIYDKVGRLVRTLVDGEQAKGVHRAEWDGLDEGGQRVPVGIYFSRLATGSSVRSSKLILLR